MWALVSQLGISALDTSLAAAAATATNHLSWKRKMRRLQTLQCHGRERVVSQTVLPLELQKKKVFCTKPLQKKNTCLGVLNTNKILMVYLINH